MNGSPLAPPPQRTTTAWTRRITLAALVFLLVLSGLRLVNALLSNTDSIVFPSAPRFPWDALVYSGVEFALILIVLIFVDAEMRGRRPSRKLVRSPRQVARPVITPEPAPAPSAPRPAKPRKPEPVYYTLTGEAVNPTEQDQDSSAKK